ncbi:MAG TPA: hypothetical protein VG073_10485 [Gaiellaceae bacterium]|nr:hypothetical protein [Gaiellaceae bacterium]
MRRLAAAALCTLVLAPAALADTVGGPVYDGKGRLVQTPFAPRPPGPHLTAKQATDAFSAYGKVHDWLVRYPRKSWVWGTTYDPKGAAWKVSVWSGKAGEIATGRVDDASGQVTEAWTGPQVAWRMARGYTGAFGGERINSYPVWLGFCAVFLLGLVDWRRLRSLRNLDLVVFLSFSVSLWYFNRGDVFTSVPLVYPALVYLLLRCLWVGARGRAAPGRAVWPAWLLLGATVFLMGFRIGLNAEASNVIDVGFAGVIGAERIAHGQAPYGHMPIEGTLKACGPADAEGEIRNRIQTNGRCESANPFGDTYGPVAYEAYLPGYAIAGWTGRWDDLPAAHVTSGLFDVVAAVGLLLVGRRFGGLSLGAVLAFAWAAYPFTQYASSSNTNDLIPPALLIWGFWLSTAAWARGALCALSAWTKFAGLLLLPLWATYPERRLRPALRFAAGALLATAAAFSILLFEPSPLHAARVFFDRTVRWQVGRDSPFSLWDWGQYHARGIPDLHLVQRVLEALLVLGALAAGLWPRVKSPLQLAALTGAILVGFELVLTHWSYLYLPWFFPFAAFAVLAPLTTEVPEALPARDDGRPFGELVAAG